MTITVVTGKDVVVAVVLEEEAELGLAVPPRSVPSGSSPLCWPCHRGAPYHVRGNGMNNEEPKIEDKDTKDIFMIFSLLKFKK